MTLDTLFYVYAETIVAIGNRLFTFWPWIFICFLIAACGVHWLCGQKDSISQADMWLGSFVVGIFVMVWPLLLIAVAVLFPFILCIIGIGIVVYLMVKLDLCYHNRKKNRKKS